MLYKIQFLSKDLTTKYRVKTMATDERNFRSAYYEKVGFKSVEEKKSLEILLKDKPLDKIKLKQFCLRFFVPPSYRNLLWKLLLGIVPVHTQSHQFVMSQRQQEYADLLHGLHLMRLIDTNTPKPQIFYNVWLLRMGEIKYDTSIQANHAFVAVCQTLLKIFDEDTDVYWLAKGFFELIEQFKQDIPKLIEKMSSVLAQEDASLHKHLQDIGVLNSLPYNVWFNCCFAGLINEVALAKIWDKLCGGSNKILVYVMVVIFTSMRLKFLKCTDYDSVIQYIDNIPEETAEIIANKAIELWQQHGSTLTIQDAQHLQKNKNI